MFNSSFNVYKTEWLDLVFANRNKNYGAYVLRSESSSILLRSLVMSSAVFILFFISPLVYGKLFPEPIPDVVTEVTLADNKIFEMKKPETPEKKEEPKKAEPEPQKVKMVKMTSNIVVTADPVIEEPPTVKDLENAVVGSKTQDGEIKPNLVLSNTINKGDGNGLGKDETGTGGGNEIIEAALADEYPEFAGGMQAWAKYIQHNLRYPSMAQEDGVQGKVFISFVVEKDGSITDVKLVKGIGAGCDEEAMRVIEKSPLWKPGKNRGTAVRVRYNMPINFTITN